MGLDSHRQCFRQSIKGGRDRPPIQCMRPPLEAVRPPLEAVRPSLEAVHPPI